MVSVPAASVAGTFFFRAKPPSRENHELTRIFTNDNAKMKSGYLRISVSSAGKINCKKLRVLAASREVFTPSRKNIRETSCLFVVLFFRF